MPRIGWHASHEQISPSRLLEDVRHAEQAGFQVGMSSDHFSPWSDRQGESGFAWSWLGAAMATTSLPFRVVNAPGQRYHPAIVAQAMATLAEMFPDRLWVCLGTGEASNEHITGERWPSKPQRNARLLECVEVIRALLAGEEVTHHGLVDVDRARLWTLPASRRRWSARRCPSRPRAGSAAGRTVWRRSTSRRERLERVVDAFREGGGEGKPMVLQVHVSWAPTEEEALTDRAPPVAYERLRAAGVLGRRDAGALRRARASRP